MARVTILLGKGGTGRTTIARAMALNAARDGPTALLHADPTTTLALEATKNLRVRVMDPHRIVEDAMAKLFPFGPITRVLVRHQAYRSFLEVAPGIKEAAVLNFLYGYVGRRAEHVILDGPATGHGLHFLEAPAKLALVTAGKVAERLRKVDAWLHDPAQTRMVLVALPEELPAVEVSELAAALRAERFPVCGLIVNKMPPPVPFRVADGTGGMSASAAVSAAEALSIMAQQRQEAERWLEELKRTGHPVRIVPSLPGAPDIVDTVRSFVEGFP